MLSIFSHVSWPSICLLWRNVYLGFLHIFWLDCLVFLLDFWPFFFFFLSFFFLFFFFRATLGHMEVPRLGVQSELKPPAYNTATVTWDLNRVCDLHHNSQQCWILNPLSKVKDWTPVLMDASQSHDGNSWFLLLSCMSCLYILEIKPLSFVPFATIFSHSIGYVFVFF